MASPGMVLVSVVQDLPGARRKLLDPRLPATTMRHRPNCTCGFDWGVPTPSTTQLGAAIMADHFEHNPNDLPIAKTLMKSADAPTAMNAAMALGPKLAMDVLVEIPPSSEWTITTSIIGDYLSFLGGSSAIKPRAICSSLEPGTSGGVAACETNPDELGVALFVQSVQNGTIIPLPAIVAEKLLAAFVSCIREAMAQAKRLAPVFAAAIGPVQVCFQLFDQSERLQIERMLGPERTRAALKTAEELFSIDALRNVFGEWISPE